MTAYNTFQLLLTQLDNFNKIWPSNRGRTLTISWKQAAVQVRERRENCSVDSTLADTRVHPSLLNLANFDPTCQSCNSGLSCSTDMQRQWVMGWAGSFPYQGTQRVSFATLSLLLSEIWPFSPNTALSLDDKFMSLVEFLFSFVPVSLFSNGVGAYRC